MLPFPIDRLLSQPVQFQSNNPPVVPNVPLLPEAQQILIYVASAVANEAGRVAGGSPARVFCYNMLSDNNWNNAAFNDVVKFVCDACVINWRSGRVSSPAQSIQESTIEVLTLYASMLVVSYPDLANTLPPQAVVDAGNNHRIFLDLVQDSETMYSQATPYQPPQRGSAMFERRQQVPVQRAQPALSNPSGRSAYGGAIQAQPAAATRGAIVKTRPLLKPETPAAAEVKEEPKKDINMLTGDIERMDRAAHGIPYFGKELPIATAPIRRKFEEAIEVFEDNANFDPETPGVNVDSSVLPMLYLDELISQLMVSWLEETEPSILTAHVRQGWVLTPFASVASLPKLIQAIENQGTFAGVANETIKYLETVTDKTELRSTLIMVSQLDRFLTKILNNFLIYELASNAPKISVTSFFEDAPAMSQYLNSEFSGKYNAAYSEYQKRVLCKLFANTRSHDDKLNPLREAFDGENSDFLTQAYTLIFINASSQELGYTTSDRMKFIRANSTPLLHRLLKAVFAYDMKRDIPANHLLILADGLRCQVHQSHSEQDLFTIVEI